jgi:hypothetical protein
MAVVAVQVLVSTLEIEFRSFVMKAVPSVTIIAKGTTPGFIPEMASP